MVICVQLCMYIRFKQKIVHKIKTKVTVQECVGVWVRLKTDDPQFVYGLL